MSENRIVRCMTCRKEVPEEQACNGDEKMLSRCKLNQNNGALLFSGILPPQQPEAKAPGKVIPFKLVQTSPRNVEKVMVDALIDQKGCRTL